MAAWRDGTKVGTCAWSLATCTRKGLSRPMASWTRRRWPSDTRFMRQAGSTSRTCISLSRRAGSTPFTLVIIVSALMSPCAGRIATLAMRAAMLIVSFHRKIATQPLQSQCYQPTVGEHLLALQTC